MLMRTRNELFARLFSPILFIDVIDKCVVAEGGCSSQFSTNILFARKSCGGQSVTKKYLKAAQRFALGFLQEESDFRALIC